MNIVGLVILGCAAVVSCQRIVNHSYKRSVFFTGPIVREEHLIEVGVADESPKPSGTVPEDLTAELHQNWFPNYVFLVAPEQAENLSSWSANLIVNPAESSTQNLAISDITGEVALCQKYGYRCLNVVLPMDGQLNRKFIIAVSVSFIDELKPKPAVVADMMAPVRLFYRSESLEPVSLYETEASQTVLLLTNRSKSLKLRCPVGRKPEKLSDVQLPMEMKGFVCKGTSSGPVEFHYESRDATMLRLRKVHRKFTHMPWSNEVQVKESFEYVHEGPQPPESPSFSRIEFSKMMHETHGNIDGLQVVPRVLVVVPKSARTLQVRDEVGIIWTEKERHEVESDMHVVQVPLRFPLIGGMSVAFDFYYTMDAGDLIKPFKASSSPFKKLIQIPMFRTVFDVPVDDFRLTFVLPEDTADIEYELASSKPVKVQQRTYRTYFSTTGEKEISFEFQKMTREDLEKGIAVLFNYPFWGAIRKPMVAFSTIVFLIIAALYINRMDLSLRGRRNNTTTTNSDCQGVLKKFFAKRREILMNFEDLIAGNVNARATAEQQKSDKILKGQLDEQLQVLQNAIFEKIKNASHLSIDPQQAALNSMALKRLYDEQQAICFKILDQLTSSNESLSDSLCASGSRTFGGSSASLGGKMLSRSASGDLMSVSKGNRMIIEAYAKDALKIDAQVAVYEQKFLK